MPSLDPRSRRRLIALANTLETLVPGTSAMPDFVPALRELLELDTATAFAYRPEPVGLSLDWSETSGRVDSERGEFYTKRLAKSSVRRPGLFDALQPERSQRNVVVALDYRKAIGQARREAYRPMFKQLGLAAAHWDATARYMEWADTDVFRPMGFGRHHLRVLVCERDTMLGWVGGCLDEAPTVRQRQLMRGLIPALRKRLFLEESVRNALVNAACLGAMLDALPTASFLVDRGGAVQRANALARDAMSQDNELRGRIFSAVCANRTTGEFEIMQVAAAGFPEYYLVRQSAGPVDKSARARAASERWGLTPRQSEVVAHVADGATNKSVAAALGVSEKTVEVHLTAIYGRIGVQSRSELIALIAGFRSP